MSTLLQWLVVGLIVGWSLHLSLCRLMPGVSRRLYAALARRMEAAGAGRLAARLQASPPVAAACDSGCSGCDTACGKTVPVTEKPVAWRAPPSSGACH